MALRWTLVVFRIEYKKPFSALGSSPSFWRNPRTIKGFFWTICWSRNDNLIPWSSFMWMKPGYFFSISWKLKVVDNITRSFCETLFWFDQNLPSLAVPHIRSLLILWSSLNKGEWIGLSYNFPIQWKDRLLPGVPCQRRGQVSLQHQWQRRQGMAQFGRDGRGPGRGQDWRLWWQRDVQLHPGE